MQKIIVALEVALVLFPAIGCSTTSAVAKTEPAQIVAEDADVPAKRTPIKVADLDASPLYFDFDEDVLDDGARAKLREMAVHLRKNSALEIAIEGHCDDLGTSEYNLALGERRADAARQYLLALGVDASRVNVVSFGEELPAVDAIDDDARSKNRRDEFVLYKAKDATAADNTIHATVQWGG